MDLELDKTSTKKIKVTKKKIAKKVKRKLAQTPLNRATPLERGLAFAIDMGICVLYYYVFFVNDNLEITFGPFTYALFYGVYLFNVALPEVLFGMSPGKFMLGLRIASFKEDAAFVSNCILRTFVLKFTLLLILPLLSFFNDNHTYYDKLLSLYVVRD